MVGVAGRSKGCKTCRDRKIKCDEARPSCVRCQKIGKECPGYTRPIHFVYSTQQKTSSVIPWEEKPSTSLIGGDKAELVVANGTQRKPKTSKARSKEAANRNIPPPTLGHQILPPSIVQSTPLNASIPFDRTEAYVKIYVQDFIHVSAPFRSVFKTAMVPYRFGHLYATHFRTGDTPETRKALEDAYAACAATYFALKEKDVHSKIQGHLLYLKLLQNLKDSLKNGLAHSDPAVFLYTCMMAAHYEILTSKSATTWLFHLTALGRLVQSLGPYSFHDPLAGAILEVIRPYLIMSAMMDHKRCFLEEPEWLKQPVAAYPGGASSWNTLVDRCTSIPRILEQSRTLFENFNGNSVALHLQDCLALMNAFFLWREEWDRSFGQPPHTYCVSSDQMVNLFTQDEQGPLFDTILYFSNISVCTTVYYYDQMLIILAHHMKRLAPWVDLYLGKYDRISIKFRQAVASIDVGTLCREVGRCIDYQRGPEFQNGSTGIFFGAKIAYDILDRQSRMWKLMEKTMMESPLLRRVGATNVDDLMQAWYGPDPPTEMDIATVQQQRMGEMYMSTLPTQLSPPSIFETYEKASVGFDS